MLMVIGILGRYLRLNKRRRTQNFNAAAMRQSTVSQIINLRGRIFFLPQAEQISGGLIKKKWIVRRSPYNDIRTTNVNHVTEAVKHILKGTRVNFISAFFRNLGKRALTVPVRRKIITVGGNLFHGIKRPLQDAFVTDCFQCLFRKSAR